VCVCVCVCRQPHAPTSRLPRVVTRRLTAPPRDAPSWQTTTVGCHVNHVLTPRRVSPTTADADCDTTAVDDCDGTGGGGVNKGTLPGNLNSVAYERVGDLGRSWWLAPGAAAAGGGETYVLGLPEYVLGLPAFARDIALACGGAVLSRAGMFSSDPIGLVPGVPPDDGVDASHQNSLGGSDHGFDWAAAVDDPTTPLKASDKGTAAEHTGNLHKQEIGAKSVTIR
jgi:hypothetical protein